MALFSERYGYIKPSDVIIRERITPEIQNAICSCFDRSSCFKFYDKRQSSLEKMVWTRFLNKREGEFRHNTQYVISYLTNPNEWYKKLDLIEFSIKHLYRHMERGQCYDIFDGNDIIDVDDIYYNNNIDNFVDDLNSEFKRLNFAYRIINKEIVEITAEEEIVAIENALENSVDNIRIHLNKALDLYAKKPIGDYGNSIKESISAVEAASRNITGENVLNFKKLEEKDIIISPVLRQAFEKLYGYTNDKSTGIRHALMEDTNTPQAEEALFMLVSCSAFINYLNKKIEKNKPV